MDRKKGIIAIVLFVFLGLMVFSFANPAGDEATTKLDSTNSENVKEEDKKVDEEVEETETTTTQARTNTDSNLLTENTETTTEEETDEEINNEDEEITNEDNKQEDEEDKNEEKDYSEVIALVESLEKKITAAIASTEITDMDEARDYNINEKIEELVSKIEDEETKKELTEKLEELYKVLNDEVKPKPYSLAILNYTHASDGGDVKVATTGDKVRVIAYFNEKLNVEPKITIDGIENEIELNYSENMSTSTRYVYVRNIKITSTNSIKDGNLLVKLVSCKDMANNSCELVDSTMTDIQNETYPYVNFDTTKPTTNILNGERVNSKIIEAIDENFDYMTIKKVSTNEEIKVTEKTYELKLDEVTDSTLFYVKVYDKAGNVSKNYNIYVDNKLPEIKGIGIIGDNELDFNENVTYKTVNLNVIDKNLQKVEIYKDNELIETRTYKSTQDKTCNLVYFVDGNYKIVVTDMAKNTDEYTFTIDNVSAIVGAANILVSGDSNEQREFYATNGDKVWVYVRFNEKLGEIPTFTFYNNGANYVVDSSKVEEKEENGNYKYSVLFDINEYLDMVDGEITFSLSNIKDKAGNDTNVVLKPTNGHKVYLDRTKPTVKYTAILSRGENYKYATNGDIIRFLIRFDEEINITNNFVVEINGKKVKFMRSADLSGWEYIVDYKIPENESNLTEGELTFKISGYEDKAGNTNDAVISATHPVYNKVVYDRTAPSISWNGTIYEPNYKNTIVTNEQFIADVIEIGSGIKVIYQNGADRTYNGKVLNVSGHSSYKFELIDNAGNKSNYNVVIDKGLSNIDSNLLTNAIDNNLLIEE